jgi:hypothetical protein
MSIVLQRKRHLAALALVYSNANNAVKELLKKAKVHVKVHKLDLRIGTFPGSPFYKAEFHIKDAHFEDNTTIHMNVDRGYPITDEEDKFLEKSGFSLWTEIPGWQIWGVRH